MRNSGEASGSCEIQLILYVSPTCVTVSRARSEINDRSDRHGDVELKSIHDGAC